MFDTTRKQCATTMLAAALAAAVCFVAFAGLIAFPASAGERSWTTTAHVLIDMGATLAVALVLAIAAVGLPIVSFVPRPARLSAVQVFALGATIGAAGFFGGCPSSC